MEVGRIYHTKDLIGTKKGILTVLAEIESEQKAWGQTERILLCRCDCGKEVKADLCTFISGNKTRCGKGCTVKKHYHQTNRREDGRPYYIKRSKKNNTTYRSIYYPEHPNAGCKGEVLEHVEVMSKILDRALWPWELVHHKNGIGTDNKPENLELCFSIGKLNSWLKSDGIENHPQYEEAIKMSRLDHARKSNHTLGQNMEDMLAFCVEVIRKEAPNLLLHQGNDVY
jgi:hypothetical protein